MAKDTLRHVETMIGEDAVVRGDIILKGGAIISGKVYGNVRTNGSVRTTKTGYIKGDVTASDAFVGGVVEGNLTTSGKVVLGSRSDVKGDIVYRQLVIEEGAHFEGRCDIAPAGGETGVSRPSGEESDDPSSVRSGPSSPSGGPL